MKINTLKLIVRTSAIVVFLICLFAFCLANGIFEGESDFQNDALGWYFLAKGIFCCLSLFLSVDILEAIRELRTKNED